jgi:uncharacterized membrane protein YagU involved in acid resistance
MANLIENYPLLAYIWSISGVVSNLVFWGSVLLLFGRS